MYAHRANRLARESHTAVSKYDHLYPWGNTLDGALRVNIALRVGDVNEVGTNPDDRSPYGVMAMAVMALNGGQIDILGLSSAKRFYRLSLRPGRLSLINC